MIVEEIKEKLNSKKSSDRRRAAKEIGKTKLQELANELYSKFLEEQKDKRTWETQCEMIKALGILGHKQTLAAIEQIIRENAPHDMITIVSATTYVQLKRNSISDGEIILQLLKTGSVSIIHGTLLALAVDKMIPSKDEIRQILSFCRDINKHKDRLGHEYGLVDSRIYLALACANWDKELTSDFLHHCIDTANNVDQFGKLVKNLGLIEVSKNSLKGKFSKAYLP